ncbi:phosphotransferase [Yinghuangia soli]|uniref:Phosphotransferase n=1 Tax=Yinghuangia soli TaxID=2908204 RepID=A0AA41PWV2_9ACTN|nr:phosphotransferase [Yinghuangia soli]MCF2527047.1 phosphotransferase [Yinghuangia soli]
MPDAMPADVPLDLLQRHIGTITAHRPPHAGYMSDLLLFVDTDAQRYFVKGQRNRPGGRLDSLKREEAINPFVRPVAPSLRQRIEDADWYILVFDAVEGRHASFLPGSSDLPAVAGALDRVGSIRAPEVAKDWTEHRWDRFSDTPELFRGDALLYTDINEDNVLIGADVHLVDWAWPTLGAGFIDPALLVIQLIAAGHAAADAEAVVAECRQWRSADPPAIDAFCAANVRMWGARQERSSAAWFGVMLDACRVWAKHRGVAG